MPYQRHLKPVDLLNNATGMRRTGNRDLDGHGWMRQTTGTGLEAHYGESGGPANDDGTCQHSSSLRSPSGTEHFDL